MIFFQFFIVDCAYILYFILGCVFQINKLNACKQAIFKKINKDDFFNAHSIKTVFCNMFGTKITKINKYSIQKLPEYVAIKQNGFFNIS